LSCPEGKKKKKKYVLLLLSKRGGKERTQELGEEKGPSYSRTGGRKGKKGKAGLLLTPLGRERNEKNSI